MRSALDAAAGPEPVRAICEEFIFWPTHRNIDTAQAYGNEHGVGDGVRSSGVPRSDLFVSSKLAAEIEDYDGAVAAIDGSLTAMGLEYLDLMLIHSPQPWNDWRGGSYAEGNREAWRAFEEAQQAGKLRSIGVSNFERQDLENILGSCTVASQVNQVLLHVGNTPDGLLTYCGEQDILIEAYSPPCPRRDAEEHAGRRRGGALFGGCSAAVHPPCAAAGHGAQLPKTANPEHMEINAQVGFVVSDADMQVLRGLRFSDYGRSSRFPVFSGK